MEEETKQIDVLCELEEQVEDMMKTISEEKVSSSNVESLFELVDIQKDIQEIKKLRKEEEIMRNYGMNYGAGYNDGSYSRGNYGDNYGAYQGNYGRRGVPGTGRGNYRGEEALDEMKYHYGNYQASGNYGAKEDSAYKMTEALKKFIYTTSEELEPNEKMMFKQALQEVVQNMEM